MFVRDAPMRTRTVFLHFVDDEVYSRIEAARPDAMRLLDELIKLLVLCCPEPPLFPISARHELEAMAALCHRLDPLLDRGHVAVIGAGSTPRAYLDRRRAQYASERRSFPRLFASAEESALAPLGAVWVAKTGDSTAAIRRAWPANVLSDRGGLISAARGANPALSDRILDLLVTLPERSGERPLIPSVVLAQLVADGILKAPVPGWVADDLTCYLGSEWLRVYSEDVSAGVLTDLGRGLPNPRGFLPPGARRLFSPLRAQSMLERLGIRSAVGQLTYRQWATLLPRLDAVRPHFADDIFDRATPAGDPVWGLHEQALLRTYDKRSRRTAIAVGYAARIRGSVRAAIHIERRMELYCDVLRNHYSRKRVTTMSIDRSINVGGISGDAQIASGDGSVQISANEDQSAFVDKLVGALIDASRSEAAGDSLLALVLADPSTASRPVAQLTEAAATALAGEELTDERRSRLRSLAAKLGAHAGQTAVGAGVLAALKMAGIAP